MAEWLKSSTTFKPRFESPLRITILIAQKWKYFVAIPIAGRRVTCVAYDVAPQTNPDHNPDQHPP